MDDKPEQENSDLTEKEKKAQMIERIIIAVITIMRTANLADTSVTVAPAATDVSSRSSKQFKPEDIEFFDSELDIEKDSIITDDKF